MTQQHFIQLARTVKFELDGLDPLFDGHACGAVSRLARGIADVCMEANPRFQRQRFYEACGLTEQGIVEGIYSTDREP